MKIGILGAGESGVGAALLAKEKGLVAFVSDNGKIADSYKDELVKNKIRFEESGHSLEILEKLDLIVKSPGIPNTVEAVSHLKEKELNVIGEIEFAFRFCNGKIIGITGSNGKTTTTNLVYHFLKSANYNVSKGGNIGTCFSRLIIEGFDWYVIELSSFQLEDIVEFKPNIAALLNVTSDHLNRYDGNIKKYMEAKCKIFLNQNADDVLFIPMDERLFDRASRKSIQLEVVDAEENVDAQGNPYLRGGHNKMNLRFAKAIAKQARVNDESIAKAISLFVNDDHRLQPVARIDEVLYVNDSKATNVDAVYYALRAFDEPIIWIVGGVDKGNNYDAIEEEVRKNVKHIIALGTDNQKVIKYFKGKVNSLEEAKNMEEAVSKSEKLADQGDVVLLSPACASFDLFDNYKDRGEQFVKEVWALLR